MAAKSEKRIARTAHSMQRIPRIIKCVSVHVMGVRMCVCFGCMSVHHFVHRATSSFNTFACQEKIACHMPHPNYDATSNLSL